MRRRRRRGHPLTEFVKPGRRRTDHPLVVGTIVLCIGVIMVATVFQVGAQIWTGIRIQQLAETGTQRAVESRANRKALLESAKSQAAILRRVCLNVARSKSEQEECSVEPPSLPETSIAP